MPWTRSSGNSFGAYAVRASQTLSGPRARGLAEFLKALQGSSLASPAARCEANALN